MSCAFTHSSVYKVVSKPLVVHKNFHHTDVIFTLRVSSLSEQSSPFREMVQQEAIVVRNAVKHYESTKLVLNGLNMTVSRGSIYGLLGASGCGKTTLLSCIVGVQRLNSGEVWVLGGNPGSKGSGIPGPRVGYMPQEISLVDEFTRNDAFYYFGRINGLENDEIEARQKFLSELLQLPPRDRLVKNMSGGQQRRLSFAAALVHEPELLVLDEPTVGLDPVLRENIWDYLVKITQEENITVVITTHYIEETKNADKIGLMRSGQLLAESAPDQLLERFQCSSLEEVFLTLSRLQEDNLAVASGCTAQKSKMEDSESEMPCQERNRRMIKDETSKYKANPKQRVSRWKRFRALMVKNSLQFFRQYTGIAFAVLFPILQVCTFFIGVGGDPKGLTIGIINDEAGNCDGNFGNVWYNEEEYTCHFNNLSCKFLQHIDYSTATKEYYDDISKATEAVHNGKLSGVIFFSRNFSEALWTRMENFIHTDEADILAGQIQVSLDMSDRQIGLFLQKKLFDYFFEFYEDVVKYCKISRKFASLPLQFKDPIYGPMDIDYRRFMASPYIITLLFFLANTISTSLIITDKAKGVWNRSLVQGVTTAEILLSHILAQNIIIVINTIMTLCLCFPILGLNCTGSIFTVACFGFFSGICGLMYGFFLSVMCTNHTTAHYASAGSLFPLILLCGVLWPVEGMPQVLRWISYLMPMTLPAISLRGVMEKGQSIYELDVYSGLFVISGWALFFLIVCLVSLRLKSTY
ncbi:ABC transporter G family member 23 isoform X1 [Harpegnathos saltator]|uniref:ABC transporter G family member 23 isoform X1 n=2 Tax=Harpegnathos saltator TaxID=610380 RepID=UPI00058EDD2B|nr:ABC transporter G family member 23 isoform X1 [Harpegnathos saltator]